MNTRAIRYTAAWVAVCLVMLSWHLTAVFAASWPSAAGLFHELTFFTYHVTFVPTAAAMIIANCWPRFREDKTAERAWLLGLGAWSLLVLVAATAFEIHEFRTHTFAPYQLN